LAVHQPFVPSDIAEKLFRARDGGVHRVAVVLRIDDGVRRVQARPHRSHLVEALGVRRREEPVGEPRKRVQWVTGLDRELQSLLDAFLPAQLPQPDHHQGR
jgi:hypothetical protein